MDRVIPKLVLEQRSKLTTVLDGNKYHPDHFYKNLVLG